MRLFRYLQSKPREVKAQYAALIAGVITGGIAVVWASTIPTRFAEKVPLVEEDDTSLTEFITDTKTQLGNIVSTKEEVEADIAENLKLLGSEETSVEVEEESTQIPPRASEKEATTTTEKPIMIETVRLTPKPILISTTTATTGGN